MATVWATAMSGRGVVSNWTMRSTASTGAVIRLSYRATGLLGIVPEATIDLPKKSGGSMTALAALWLPILVSAVAVFVVSSIIHMTPLWHKSDYPRYPNEDRVLDALRPIGI